MLSAAAVFRAARRRLPSVKTLRQEAVAGLPGAISAVPDGMASGVLVGVSPVHGLYASVAGPIAGGLTSSTRLMVVTTTSAAALAAGSALSSTDSAHRAGALTVLTVVAGIAMVVAGLIHLGRYARFVSHSVMTGFLTGVALNIFLGQIPSLLGATGHGPFNFVKVVDILVHPGRIQLASALTGLVAILLVVGLRRTRLASVSSLFALAVPTIGVIIFGADGVQRVKDSGAVPSGIPLPALPALSDLNLDVVLGALSVAAIVLVQGVGVAQSAPNPGGAPSNVDRDFVSQGVGNVASGLLQGQPVGGSLGGTALGVSSGAKTRWAGVWSGIWMLVILLAFSGIIGNVAEPTLAGLLIYAGCMAIRPAQIRTILRTGTTSQVALVATFLATLLLPVATAVGIGIVISLLLQLNREALDLRLVQLVPDESGRFREQPAPTEPLASRSVTLLDVYGSLLYAGARTLQARLPDPGRSDRAAVILRLRGRTQLGATFFLIIEDYDRRLAAVGGRLYLSGVDPALLQQFTRAQGPAAERITLITASSLVGESSTAAYDRATAWITEEHSA